MINDLDLNITMVEIPDELNEFLREVLNIREGRKLNENDLFGFIFFLFCQLNLSCGWLDAKQRTL